MRRFAMSKMDEELRIQNEYDNRDARLPWNDWKTNTYHPRHPIGNLLHEHNHCSLIGVLNRLDLDLANLKILDVGCGYGYWLRYLVELGAYPKNCVGVDLSAHRIDVARQKNPAIRWHQHNIAALSFPDWSFDLVIQCLVFSSVLDPQLRIACAAEMQRVTKHGGIVLWLDLTGVVSKSLVSFSESDVQKYFPQMQIIYRERMHPRYFRRLYGKYAWLAKAIYHFTKFGCESSLVILRKTLDE